jgi:predicted DsbA family dithiol-disulfide isomerase
MKQRLMELFFTEGADLSDNEVLLAAARDCAMDTKLIRRRLESEEDIAEVSADAQGGRDSGIDGVPCFILGGVCAISGAQAPEVLADAIARAAAAAGGDDLCDARSLVFEQGGGGS